MIDKCKDNSYTFREADFPSADELRQAGIKRVIYLDEGDFQGKIQKDKKAIDRAADDLKETFTNWEQNGIEVVYTGIKPWGNFDGTDSWYDSPWS